MKVTLDLAKLVEQGRITPDEAQRLRGFAAEATGSAALNILVGFGVAAVALGFVGLVPRPEVAVVLGAMLGGVGLGFILARQNAWSILANICLLVGALMLAAGVVFMTEGSLAAMLLVAAIFAAGAVAARSGLLAALAVLALAAALGGRTGYMRATYVLAVEQPLLTVVLFSGLALAGLHASKRLGADLSRLAIVAARTALVLVNLGFWIGSLWGDRLSFLVEASAGSRYNPAVPPLIFSLGWAAALVGAGLWAARANRPWVLNLAAVFGAIHFYTQWFERLGPNPASILIAGIVTLAAAVAIWKYNRGKTFGA